MGLMYLPQVGVGPNYNFFKKFVDFVFDTLMLVEETRFVNFDDIIFFTTFMINVSHIEYLQHLISTT